MERKNKFKLLKNKFKLMKDRFKLMKDRFKLMKKTKFKMKVEMTKVVQNQIHKYMKLLISTLGKKMFWMLFISQN